MDIFCKIIKGEIPSKVVYEDEVVLGILDVNPTSSGHTLIIPKMHYQDLFDIEESVLNHIMIVAKEVASMLEDKLGCSGVTLVQNNGIAQEVKHFHLHIIPKYNNSVKLSIDEVFHKVVD